MDRSKVARFQLFDLHLITVVLVGYFFSLTQRFYDLIHCTFIQFKIQVYFLVIIVLNDVIVKYS